MSVPEIITPFDGEGQWYKANLHTHTTNSDGTWSPQEAVDAYRKKGYDILAITDHDHLTNVDEFQRDDFLMIPSAEYHPLNSANTYGERHHLVCLNLKQEHGPTREKHVQDLVKAVIADGGMVIAGHPYWLKQNISDLQQLDGISAMEVFNTVCKRVGREYSDQIWDDYCLRVGPVGGIADDDCHGDEKECGGGWVWIRAKELTLPAVMDALKNEMYYASTGPKFKSIRVVPDVEKANNWKHYRVFVECEPVKSILGIVGRGGERIEGENGEDVTSAEIVVGTNMPFVRIEIHAADGTKAWASPIKLKGEW